MNKPLLALMFAFALAACGTNGPTREELAPVPPTPPTLRVEVGGGLLEFEELADGAPVDLTYGPQGGFHIWTSVRVYDETVKDVEMNLVPRYEDGSPAGPPSRAAAQLGPDIAGAVAAVGQRSFVGDAAGARGRRIVLRVEVIAADRRHGAGEKTVTAK